MATLPTQCLPFVGWIDPNTANNGPEQKYSPVCALARSKRDVQSKGFSTIDAHFLLGKKLTSSDPTCQFSV